MSADRSFQKSISINASASQVWNALTDPELMKQWMSESELTILTNWEVGSPFIIRGDLHDVKFENKGKVLQFEKEKVLSYNHLSSISGLRDEIENYSVLEFKLIPLQNQIKLTLTLSVFPTETIYKHLEFYWNVTLEELKKIIEKNLLK